MAWETLMVMVRFWFQGPGRGLQLGFWYVYGEDRDAVIVRVWV